MIKQKRKIDLRTGVILLLFAVMCVFCMVGKTVFFSRAATEVDGKLYTDVMTDLSKDASFSSADYPALQDGDYSMNVIQIAESTSGEVFVYVYEPRRADKAFTAMFLNMSLSDTVDGTKLYDLRFINADGVFCKYSVVGLTVSDDAERFYTITSIYRAYDKDVDGDIETSQYKNAVAFSVGKSYKATTVNGVVQYSCLEIKTVQILNPFADYLRYSSGFFLYTQGACDAHYVAFDVDIDMDYLLSANLSFETVDYTRNTNLVNGTSADKPKKYPDYKVTYLQTGETVEEGFFAHKPHSWHRIEKTEDFVKNEKLTEATKRALLETKWVLRFLETSYKETTIAMGGGQSIHWTAVQNVTILRLEYLLDGIVYNVGAVSDMVTEDPAPGNTDIYDTGSLSVWARIWNWIKSFFTNYWWVILVIVGVILLIVFFPVLGPILWSAIKLLLKGIWWLLKHLCMLLWWIVSAPFRFVKWVIDKIRGKADDADAGVSSP